MTDTAKNINLSTLLNSIPKAENLLRQFATVFNIPWTNHKIVRAKLQQQYEKRIFPPINTRVKGEVRTRLKSKWQREGKNPSGGVFETQVVIEFDEWTKLGKDKEHRRRSQKQQRINTCHDIIEGKSSPETDLPSGFEMDNDGNSQTPNAGPNTDNAPCYKCKKKQSVDWKYRKPPKNQWWCINCWNLVPNCAYPGCYKKGWKVSAETGTKRFCTGEHLKEWLKNKENQQNSPPRPRTKQQYFQELNNLMDWELLNYNEQEKFKDMIRNSSSETDWKNAIQQAKQKIAERRRENGEEDEEEDNNNNTNLAAEIQKAIQEIKTELNKEPKITLTNDDWQTYISTSANLGELQSRKQEVLDNVRDLRRQNALNEAIQRIKNALSQQPVIKNEELSNPNWENELNSLSEENQIISLRDRILGEIKQKRAKKEIASKLDNLISQAQTAIANNDLINLEKLLSQIETYQGTSSYEERKSDIEKLFQQLATVNLPKYRELTINSLDEFLQQDPPLSLDELEKANQNFAEQIKNASSAEEIKNIKNSVSNNINQGRSNKIVVNLINQAKQARTEQEKSDVRQKISELENSGNRWIKDALEAKKDELQQIVNSWILGEIPSNTNSPPSNDKKPNDNLPLTIFLVVVIGGIAIVGGWLFTRRQKRQVY
ncbi:protein of unknown function [endosymbiont DhMRE of Dentiscutata heterogama]|uniref:hypothetical protein n=1 Tax=endosymbiont DhMRE of Dentiscutata heterogama TaxID=1609546 RepID=UPI000629D37B|nr:hypothetical protein [endosymbiont DhMRE of Dentiscutata heterogama]CFW92921.1 protein of unknown function [endosymbiont DhMRE of Dentiscutata heterogama]